jgi:hypothetical protein
MKAAADYTNKELQPYVTKFAQNKIDRKESSKRVKKLAREGRLRGLYPKVKMIYPCKLAQGRTGYRKIGRTPKGQKHPCHNEEYWRRKNPFGWLPAIGKMRKKSARKTKLSKPSTKFLQFLGY